jgi:hypothetical protein
MGRRQKDWERWAQRFGGREDHARARDTRTGDSFDDIADGIAASVDRIAEGFSAATDPAERERRRLEKLERRKRQEEAGRRTIFGVGAGLLAGGLAASTGLMTVAAVGVGLLTGASVIYTVRWWQETGGLARPRLLASKARPALDDPTIAGQDSRTLLVRSVVSAAMGHVRAIDRLAATTPDLELAAILTRIAAIGHRVCQSVAAQPATLENAQRLLTYHIEKAAKLADLSSEAEGPRLDGVRRVLGRMELLFEQTEAALKHEDGRELDLELRLIDQALDEDLRR